ncbi:U4/U6 small nuclear ribonucleoprotein PRP4 [Kwoniella heveanensis BCC8398]|uniref:U4/U6 small nuclear ribonucleoprotein PRP4 n=1 Tax=Kwoniella heveanensis BCC8398 TaxID=1296120 RepID=A0A1B9H2X5_9TREE|nr:U4/U6 small nuclear ribonucleoprotein PRP4 [Kwoniella heveanensis BCC8398]
MDIDDLTVDNTYQLGGSDDERERAQNAALVEQLERKKRLRKMAVPTDDKKVRERLRAYGEPITLFGEGPGDRRDRLKYVQEQIEQARGGEGMEVDAESDESSDEEEEEGEFYTEGTDALLEARRKLARYSLSRARTRIARQRVETGLPLGKIVNQRKEVFSELKTFNNLGSQFGDDRPLSTIRFSPNSQYILTTSWTGQSKLWDLPNLNPISTKRGHTDKIGGAAWHPQATLSIGAEGLNFATGGGEGSVKLWSIAGDKPLATLNGHENRVGRIAFHPSGSYLGSAGFDGTWRLWDMETHQELLVQEGHSKEVYALAFQDDGALVASGGFDAIGRVWDVRTGRTAMVLDGHVKEILTMDFAPNGYQVATGSGDDTVRIWDLRALKTQHIIPAHKSSVSDVRFFRSSAEIDSIAMNGHLPLSGDVPNGETDSKKGTVDSAMDVDPDSKPVSDEVSEADIKPTIDANGSIAGASALKGSSSSSELPRSGLFLVTAGFDCNVRIWSSDEWSLIRNLPTDAGKVMSVDVSPDGRFIGSASYSRSFHLFGGDKSL